MTKKHVRVRLVWADAADGAERLGDQLLLDVIIDSETRLVSEKHPFFGVYGPPLGDDALPFVMRADGSLDFGAMSDPGDRMDWLNLREKPVRIGEYATYGTKDESWTCRIVQVTDLATGQPA